MAETQSVLPLSEVAQSLFDSYESLKRREITHRRFTQQEMLRWLEPMINADRLGITGLGRSAEGRALSLYTYGTGETRVLLWSQMHGDEPTATMALLDILNFFALRQEDVLTRMIQANLTLLMVPMLNPDGAERFTRRTAQMVDMNRDALALETPEARILRDTQHKFQPQFGFNLHDQDPRLTVGSTKNVTAIALLAPARDVLRTDNEVRTKAKKVASVFAEAVNLLVPGHAAKYDDTFDRRAFGDSVQLWGTSTVLVESGGWPNDREKMFIRELNFVGLLTSLYSIATGEYEQKAITPYESLPFNTKNLYDIIIRSVEFRASKEVAPIHVDIGLNIEEMNQDGERKRLMAKVVDLGDLSAYGSFEERDGSAISLKSTDIQLDKAVPWESLHHLLK